MLPLHQLLYSSSLAPIVLYLVRTVRQATVGTRRVPDILPFAINGKQVLRDIENTLAQQGAAVYCCSCSWRCCSQPASLALNELERLRIPVHCCMPHIRHTILVLLYTTCRYVRSTSGGSTVPASQYHSHQDQQEEEGSKRARSFVKHTAPRVQAGTTTVPGTWHTFQHNSYIRTDTVANISMIYMYVSQQEATRRQSDVLSTSGPAAHAPAI